MRTVQEYVLDTIETVQTILVDGYNGVAAVGDFKGSLTVWCHVNTNYPIYEVDFLVTETDQEVPREFRYHGSVIMGQSVWHVWERIDTETMMSTAKIVTDPSE